MNEGKDNERKKKKRQINKNNKGCGKSKKDSPGAQVVSAAIFT